MRIHKLFPLLVLTLSSLGASAQTLEPSASGATICHSRKWSTLERSARYCLIRTNPEAQQKEGEPVIFFFHSMGGDADRFAKNGYEAALKKLQLEAKASGRTLPAATIITFDTSKMSFFTDAGGRSTGPDAFESWFVKELVPYVEKTHRLCSARSCRGALGVSMGGFGALKTAFRHPALFSNVAVNAPALVPLNVYDPIDQWNKYFGRHPVGATGSAFLFVAKRVFSNASHFDQNNPLWLVRNLGPDGLASVPSVYMDVGDKDDFGFQEGFEFFRRELQAHSVPHTAKIIPGMDHYKNPGTLHEHLEFVLAGITPPAR
jgi:S-formylglutathione hydrolase FrmB